jgi:hypothetical protein
VSPGFDVQTQSGGTINNIGRDQHVHLSREARRRLAVAGKCMAVLGFMLALGGFVALVALGITTAQNVIEANSEGTLSRWTDYVPPEWQLAAGSRVGGLVLGRLGRLLAT